MATEFFRRAGKRIWNGDTELAVSEPRINRREE
jgi:hypothetical protein